MWAVGFAVLSRFSRSARVLMSNHFTTAFRKENRSMAVHKILRNTSRSQQMRVLRTIIVLLVCVTPFWYLNPLGNQYGKSELDFAPTKLLFKSNQLGERGTEVAIFDYALFAEKFFYVESYFVFKKLVSTPALHKFESHFPGRIFLPDAQASDDKRSGFVNYVAANIKPDAFYSMEAGHAIEETVQNTTNLIHAVFSCELEHGDKYVAISDFVYHTGGKCQNVVPYMVWLPEDPVESLRRELRIPKGALVFGWYGGHDAWDDNVTPIVLEVARKRREDVFFLFRNFKDDSQLRLDENSNIISLPADSDLMNKKRFIQTCDVFLHTRTLGETFGLAVAEFSLLQRPIITNRYPTHRFHLDILQEDCYTYVSMSELEDLLLSLTKSQLMRRDFAARYKEFYPAKVMEVFNKVFFDGRLVQKSSQ